MAFFSHASGWGGRGAPRPLAAWVSCKALGGGPTHASDERARAEPFDATQLEFAALWLRGDA